MSKVYRLLEEKFTIFTFLFFTNALAVESLFVDSEGELGSAVETYTPLTSLLSLIQHLVFLLSIFLLLIHWRSVVRTVLRNTFIWLLLGLIVMSFLWSDFPDLTQRRSLALLETTTFGIYVAARYSLKEQLKFVAWAIGIAALLSLLFTLALPSRGIESGVHTGAWRGVFIQKNLFARLMVLGSLVFLSLRAQDLTKRYLLKITLCLTVGLVILSTSKTALSILVFLFFLRFIYHKLFQWEFKLVVPFLGITVLGFSCLVVFVFNHAADLLQASGRDLTLSGRTIIWSALLDKIQERPWLGYGYVGFWHGIYGESAYVGKVYGSTYIPPHSHNGFFELVLAFGFIGALFFVLSFLSTGRRAIISAHWSDEPEGLWPLLYLSFLIFYNMTESTLVEHNSIFWVLYVSLTLSRFIPDIKRIPQSSGETLSLQSYSAKRMQRWQK